MLFRFIFKKRLKELENKKKEYDEFLELNKTKLLNNNEILKVENETLKHKNKELKVKNIDLTKEFNFEKNRFERIKYLLKNKEQNKLSTSIETTKKGNKSLSMLNTTNHEIELFDIDNSPIESKAPITWVKLWPNMRKKQIFVRNNDNYIEGFEELAMKLLLNLAEQNSNDSIHLEITEEVLSNKDKLISIYKNLGFTLKYFSDK